MASDPNKFFEDDDEETLVALLGNATADCTFPSRLESLSKRFREDHDRPSLDRQWKFWMDAVKKDGFQSAGESSQGAVSALKSSSSRPEAFDSGEGKKHLEATKALLGLSSDQRAAQVTLSALRELQDSKNLQALLGTRRLVAIVMDYYYKQRIARVDCVAELLRQEQDGGATAADCIAKVLGELDSSYSIDGKHRGLFKCLVSIACQKADGQVLTRDQMMKTKELGDGAPTSLRESMIRPSGDNSWHQFAAMCLSSTRACMHQERIRAMEALVALLYSRVQGGVGRVDYMILLKAFQSADGFFTACVDGEKLSHLAGLICAECTGLWRVFDEDNSVDTAWVANHPLLSGVLPPSGTSQAESEIEALKAYILRLPELNRGMLDPNQMEAGRSAPESMAYLSLGLLLMMTYQTILASNQGSDGSGFWQLFNDEGQKLVMQASSELGAFDVFYTIMRSLVMDPPSRVSDNQHSDLPYDRLLCGKSKSSLMEINDGADVMGMEMDGASIINASIGQECVMALIAAFGESILAPDHDNFPENLSMICDLVASIYRSSPVLCQRFWTDWEQYTSPNPPRKAYWPLCQLVDLAFSLMNKAANSREKDGVVGGLAPLMLLLASLCYSADRVESVFDILHPTMIQNALAVSAIDADAHGNEIIVANRLRLLNSLAAMTRLGDSTACRNKIRETLGAAGPTALMKIIASSDERCSQLALDIAAGLLKEATVEWTLAFAKGLQTPNLFDKSETLPLARIFNALATSMPLVVFSERVSESEADIFLDVVWSGVLRLSPVLPLCLSNISTEMVPLKTVIVILEFCSTLLQNLAAIESSRHYVSSQALRMKSAMVELLSSHIGESLMFYALLPLSWSIAQKIESYAEQRSILRSASIQENSLTSKYGQWQSLRGPMPTQSSETKDVKDLVESAGKGVEKMKDYREEDDVMLVVSKSLFLLRLWAINVEGVVTGELHSQQETVALTPEQRERLASLSPHKFLSARAALPNTMRKGNVRSLYESVSPTNFQLLAKYTQHGWPFNLSAVSIDLLHACISHMKMSAMKETLKDAVQRSNIFELVAPLATCEPESTGINATESYDSREARMLSILAFRLAASTLEALPTVDAIASIGAKLVKAAFSEIGKACENLHKAREASSKLGQDNDALLENLAHGTACLGFVGAVWDEASQLEGPLRLTNEYDHESTTFTALTKVLLQHAYSENEIEPSASGCVCSFLAAALQFLRVATAFAARTEKLKSCDMLRMVKENALQLISMPQHYIEIDEVASDAIAEFDTQSLLAHFPIVAVSEATVGFFNVDVSALSASLPPLDGDGDVKDSLFAMALSQYNFKSRVTLLCQWRKFVDVLLQLSAESQKASSAGVGNALVRLAESHTDKYVIAATEVARSLGSNLTVIESAAEDGIAVNAQDVSQIAESMTGLVLVLVSASGLSDGEKPTNPDSLIQILALISSCASKLFNIKDAEVCCRVEQSLLSATMGIVMSAPLSRLGDVVDQYVRVIHQLLRLLETQSVENNECLKTCIVLLTMLTTTAEGVDLLGGKSGLLKDVVGALVRVAMRKSETIAGHITATNRKEQGEEIEVIELIVEFVHAILGLSSEMLELVYSSGALQLFTRSPIFEHASELWGSQNTNTALRGYIPTQGRLGDQNRAKSTSFFAGSEDPIHRLWRKILKCFRALCRARRQFFSHSPDKFQALAADFIYTHHTIMLGCLKNVESAPFTKNSLAEATHTLSLLSEFCARPCRDDRTLSLISGFKPAALQLMARLGSFLGASAASRELFNSMGDTDSDDSSNMASRLSSPFNRVHNARHEAIRYSHFASRFCTAVTKEDVSESSSAQDKRIEDNPSATDLEVHGKALMNSQFAKTMELSAAECLFAAGLLLWETHPINSSFVTFGQNSRIDPMPLVKQGIIIGYASDRRSQRPCGSGYAHFAQVLHVNTIDRAFYVRDLEAGEDEIVKAHQIIGMEDASKRQCLLRYAPAPDSATELESDTQSVSVGHVILALRWCTKAAPPVSRFAELLSAFLGAELAMHKEIGSPLSKEPEVLNRLFAQLLDLFSAEPQGGSLAGARGRLSGILLEQSYATIRRQLKDELQAAEEARENEMMIVEDDGMFLRSNSGGRNPFHDLRMNYQ